MAIRTLAVRGAPAIGVFGAFSLALAISRGEDPERSYADLIGSRPTAVDLKNCLDITMEAFRSEGSEGYMKAALNLRDKTVASCKMIGKNGARLIPARGKVMTHCNAGALATIDWGTALAPIRVKAREGGKPFVWVSETRPLLQGSRLTAWELNNEGIGHSIIVDGCSGHLMADGKVDMVIVGADRVARNGDIANKIGTLEKAVLAKEYDVPFYVAFPETTFDPLCQTGRDIPIESRAPEEVLGFHGMRTSPDGSSAVNPAFDVTPARLITGYITEKGVLAQEDLKNTF